MSRLAALTTERHVLALLALDHRDALRNAFRNAGVADVDEETMLAAKQRIVRALRGFVSGVLLDPLAARACDVDGLSVLLPLEEQGHEELQRGRLNTLLRGFSPRDARALGASGCKLLLYFRADHVPTAARQLVLAQECAEACHEHGLPLVLEPLVYRLRDEEEGGYRERFGALVAEAAARLATSGADVLKLQFPGSDCGTLTEAAAPLPWALLGGGEVDGETFARHLAEACDAGGSGFIAGRAVWAGMLGLTEEGQEQWLRQTAAPLLARLRAIADERARPL